MKLTKIIGISAVSLASTAIVNAQLLVDQFAGVDPADSSPWTDAGVVEDLSGAAGGTLNGGIFNITNLTAAVTGAAFSFNGSNYSNDVLNGYMVLSGTATYSFGGFESGGVANTMISSLGAMDGNSFTLEADTDYLLYLFGSGDGDNQNTAFTFDGETKSTSVAISGTAADAGHFVTFDFTTGSDLTGFTLDFTAGPGAGSNGIFNGLALVAVPEPSSYAVIFGMLALTGACVRRSRK